MEYVYGGNRTTANWVLTRELGPNGNQIGTYEIYDGQLRLRQTQTTAPDGNRTVSDVRYNSAGHRARTSEFYNAAVPANTLLSYSDADVGSQTRYAYDGLGRISVSRCGRSTPSSRRS